MVLSEINSPLAFGAAIAPCIIAPFESKLPEALNTATPVLTSPAETSEAEENGFSLKL